MIKHLLAAAFACATNASQAEWVEVASNAQVATYMDSESVRMPADKIFRVWLLASYTQAIPANRRSSKTYQEFDCLKATVRGLAVTWYSGPMGSGRVIDGDHIPEVPRFFPPASALADVANIVCNQDNLEADAQKS